MLLSADLAQLVAPAGMALIGWLARVLPPALLTFGALVAAATCWCCADETRESRHASRQPRS